MDDDNLIIRNLPLFLSDAAWAWLEHLQLRRPSQSLRRKLPGHVRAPRELLGSPKLPPAAGRIHAGLHPVIFEAAH
jgi:hypothetical protein